MRWPMIEKLYKTELSSTGIFDQTDASETNLWLEFKDRVIEHVISSLCIQLVPFILVEYSNHCRLLPKNYSWKTDSIAGH